MLNESQLKEKIAKCDIIITELENIYNNTPLLSNETLKRLENKIIVAITVKTTLIAVLGENTTEQKQEYIT